MKNMIKTVAVLALTLGASSAFACRGNPPPNCHCNPSTGNWDQNSNSNVNSNVNNNQNVNTNLVNTNVNNNVHNTANGGAGGNAVANGGAGGSVVGSGNSSNVNNVTGGNSNSNSSATIAAGAVNNNVSGGNATIAAGAVKNDVSSTSSANNNGNLSNVGNSSSQSNANNNGSNNTTVAAASADGAGANNGNNSNNTTVEGDSTVYKAAKIPVSTAYAAGLTSGMDTCLGSASGGIQTGVLGLSFGKTKTDKNCVTIKRTHLIAEFSVPAGCAYMLKNVAGAAEAFKEVGAVCVPEVVETEVSVAVAPPALVEVPAKKVRQ